MGTSIKSDRLASFARMQGGFRTYDFSQAQAFRAGDPNAVDQGKLYKMVLRGGRPMGGVCATLCAFWVAFHAQQDIGNYKENAFTRGRSVWDYLFKDGGLNLGAATNITVEHHKSSGDQVTYLENFLKSFKVIRRKGITSGQALEQTMPLSQTSLIHCASAITSKTGGYKLISLRRSAGGGGHMVGAWCGTDVLFMDPNYGEFWLPTKEAFKAWFTFYGFNTYTSRYDRMIVRDYGIAI